jgi:MFS family permease
VLTSTLVWRWFFLVNVPIGVTVCILSLRVLPRDDRGLRGQRLDLAGAVIVTSALMLAVYAIVNGNLVGWLSAQTLGLLAGAVLLLTTFVILESRIQNPLVPMAVLRVRNLSAASGVGVLWAGAMFAFFFLSALYLQLVLGYTPLQVGLAFLPANVIMSGVSLGLSAKLVGRYGVKAPVTTGLGLVSVGLLLFAGAPLHAVYMLDILPSMILLGLGGGMALNPLLLAAMDDVAPSESGVASGVVNTAIMMGGALGLAVLTSAAASRTTHLLASGNPRLESLLGGYHVAYLIGAAFALIAVALTASLIRAPGTSTSKQTTSRDPRPALAETTPT